MNQIGVMLRCRSKDAFEVTCEGRPPVRMWVDGICQSPSQVISLKDYGFYDVQMIFDASDSACRPELSHGEGFEIRDFCYWCDDFESFIKQPVARKARKPQVKGKRYFLTLVAIQRHRFREQYKSITSSDFPIADCEPYTHFLTIVRSSPTSVALFDDDRHPLDLYQFYNFEPLDLTFSLYGD